jgi:hypothetical protein
MPTLYFRRRAVSSDRPVESIRQLSDPVAHPKSRLLHALTFRSEMKAMKTIRNIVGTVGLLYAGYILIASMKDVRRYIRISTM